MYRETRICGTKGELRWDGGDFGPITVYDFATREETNYIPDNVISSAQGWGHGGADFYLIESFTKAICFNDPSLVLTGIKESLKSHRLVFAAERSRVNQTIETIDI